MQQADPFFVLACYTTPCLMLATSDSSPRGVLKGDSVSQEFRKQQTRTGESDHKEKPKILGTVGKYDEEEGEEPSSEDELVDQMTISKYFLSRRKPNSTPPFMWPEKEEMSLNNKRPARNKKRPPLGFEVAPLDCKRIRRSEIKSQIDSSSIMDQAKEVQANLDSKYPSFIKLMLRSHVSGGFWLRLPAEFCKMHLPKHDKTIVLLGERNQEYETNFLASKVALSGGWRGFSVAHDLCAGDVVVFHLVEPLKFKVYIVRANSWNEVDGALGLLNLDNHGNALDYGGEKCKSEQTRDNLFVLEPSQSSLVTLKNTEKDDETATLCCVGYVNDQCCGDCNLQAKDNEEQGVSGSFVKFQNFRINLNGSHLDCHLSEQNHAKYYELCRSQKSHLHDCILPNLSQTLATEIICETINIADYITSSKLSTSEANFACWGKTLAGFELLGMNVGFLCARLQKLTKLVAQLGETPDSRRYNEARLERDSVQQKIKSLEAKRRKLKRSRTKLDSEIGILWDHIQRNETAFRDEASAPW